MICPVAEFRVSSVETSSSLTIANFLNSRKYLAFPKSGSYWMVFMYISRAHKRVNCIYGQLYSSCNRTVCKRHAYVHSRYSVPGWFIYGPCSPFILSDCTSEPPVSRYPHRRNNELNWKQTTKWKLYNFFPPKFMNDYFRIALCIHVSSGHKR
jgi:hypothetical protein